MTTLAVIGVGRLVSIKNWWFSGSMFIYQRVTAPSIFEHVTHHHAHSRHFQAVYFAPGEKTWTVVEGAHRADRWSLQQLPGGPGTVALCCVRQIWHLGIGKMGGSWSKLSTAASGFQGFRIRKAQQNLCLRMWNTWKDMEDINQGRGFFAGFRCSCFSLYISACRWSPWIHVAQPRWFSIPVFVYEEQV